jgi:hypothetical protein
MYTIVTETFLLDPNATRATPGDSALDRNLTLSKYVLEPLMGAAPSDDVSSLHCWQVCLGHRHSACASAGRSDFARWQQKGKESFVRLHQYDIS